MKTDNLRPWWGAITTLLVAAIFLEAVFAGAILSGVGWAHAAHAATAAILIASTAAAGLVSVVTLRHIPHGPKLGWTLLSLAAVLSFRRRQGRYSARARTSCGSMSLSASPWSASPGLPRPAPRSRA